MQVNVTPVGALGLLTSEIYSRPVLRGSLEQLAVFSLITRGNGTGLGRADR